MLEGSDLVTGFVEWELPGGRPPIGLKRLGVAGDGSVWSVVRFPAEFRRPGAVYLGVEEGYLMLEGELFYSAVSTPVGTYTVIPEGAARVDTHTKTASRAIVRFGGPPRWLDGPPPVPASPIRSWRGGGRQEGPLGSWEPFSQHGTVAVGKMRHLSLPGGHPGAVLVSLTDEFIIEVEAGGRPPELTPPIVAWVSSVTA